MKNCVIALLVLCLAVVTNGFVVPAPAAFAPRAAKLSQITSQVSSRPAGRTVASSLRMAAKSEAPQSMYWEGEWVCADCGYIYDSDDCGGLFFEQQKYGWVCPQCRGPRRRFAKKVGDQVGITQDGGDTPILLFSFIGLAGTVAFGFWFAGQ